MKLPLDLNKYPMSAPTSSEFQNVDGPHPQNGGKEAREARGRRGRRGGEGGTASDLLKTTFDHSLGCKNRVMSVKILERTGGL
jgi:hypothetical protein